MDSRKPINTKVIYMNILNDIEYQLIRSKRKTITIEVTTDCRVIVRAPNRCSNLEIETFIRRKTGWIKKNLAEMEARREAMGDWALTDQDIEMARRAAKIEFPKLVKKWAPEVLGDSHPYPKKVSIRHQKTLWGSCNKDGNLSFNCVLMFAPEEVRDYVVVHELCHIIELNHSNRFWREVARVLPNYRESYNWLKEKGSLLLG